MTVHRLDAPDGHRIRVYTWLPDDEPCTAVIHLFHGLGEHAGRYERFARACNARHLAVVAHDHRGHGAQAELVGHFADDGGWNLLISDAFEVQETIRHHLPERPIVLLGHSMGSFIAQRFAMRHPDNLAMLILSASTFGKRSELRAAHALARGLALVGKRTKPRLLHDLGFGAFNKAFQPTRTEMDWLSRDEQVVDRYLADPFCGGLFTAQLWADLTGGLLEITSRNAVAGIPRELPLLIFGGEKDPVGGTKGLTRLADVYRDTGHREVSLKIYPGGRHEMLNEINRDEVTGDVLAWIEARLIC